MKTKPPTATINLSPDLVRDLDALVAQFAPFLRRHTVHVAALRLGLNEIRKDSSKLVALLRERAT